MYCCGPRKGENWQTDLYRNPTKCDAHQYLRRWPRKSENERTDLYRIETKLAADGLQMEL